MITKETALEIYQCYQQIEACDKLMSDMKEQLLKTNDHNLPDAFGNKRGLELAVPLSDSSSRLFNVPIDLSVKIIEAHRKTKEERLIELSAVCKIQLT